VWQYNYSAELTHYGILGMKWGVRKEYQPVGRNTSDKPARQGYKEKVKNKYLSKGYTEQDSESIAERKRKIRTAALIAAGVTVAVGAAFVARHYHIENHDVTLKAGAKTFHIDRSEVRELESGMHFYTTIDQFDRKAYQWRLNNPQKVQRVERIFEMTKDVKIPSPRKGEVLYNQFRNDPKNMEKIKEAFGPLEQIGIKGKSYKDFITAAPYFSEGESFGGFKNLTSHNKAGAELWKDYQKFIVNKGYQGLLDENDRNPAHHFNVERPAILFDAASKLKEVSRKNIKDAGGLTPVIPTIRELGSVKTAKVLSAIGGMTALKTLSDNNYVDVYRRSYPNSKLTNKEIIKAMGDPFEYSKTIEKYKKITAKNKK
jgi:hypothetical protein